MFDLIRVRGTTRETYPLNQEKRSFTWVYEGTFKIAYQTTVLTLYSHTFHPARAADR
jgi:hypothetical protein